MRQVLSAAGVALLLITLTSCGSGGGSHSVSIAITTAPGSIPGGTQYIFEATTTNSQSQTSGVSWVLAFNVASNGNTTTPCDASCGTLSNTGTTVTSTTTSGSTTYYNLLYQREQYKVQAEELRQAQQLLDENTIKRQTGVLTDLDVMQARAGVAANQNQLILDESSVSNAILNRIPAYQVWSKACFTRAAFTQNSAVLARG